MKCAFCKKNAKKKDCFTLDNLNSKGNLTTNYFCSVDCLEQFKKQEENKELIIDLLETKTIPKIINDLIKNFDVYCFNSYLNNNIDYFKRTMANKKWRNQSNKNKYFLAILNNGYKDIPIKREEITDNNESYVGEYSKTKKKKPRKTIFDV